MSIPFNQSAICPTIIGRTADLVAISSFMQQTKHSLGRVLLLSGEAGIGKSRLVTEIKASAAEQGFLTLQGSCFPTDLSYPYAPLLDLMHTYFNALPAETLSDLVNLSTRELFPLLPYSMQLLPELAALPPLPQLQPEQEKRRLFSALTQFFIHLAAEQPLLLIIEDLHWCDDNSLEFLHYLARHSTNQPLLLLLTLRSVQDAVQQRKERLPETSRQVLQLAAVIGRRFDFVLLQQLSSYDELLLLSIMKELIAAQLVVEESADLSTHFFEAGLWSKALAYAHRAGESAQALHAPQAAAEHYTLTLQALQRLALPPDPAIYRARGHAFETLGEFGQALDDYQRSLESAQAIHDQHTEWQSLVDLGSLWAERDYARGGNYYQQTMALARTMDDPTVLAHSLNRIANWHLNLEQPQEATRLHEEALSIFRTVDEQGQQGHVRGIDMFRVSDGKVAEKLSYVKG